MKKNILSMTESLLRDEMLLIGEKPYRGSQIYKWVNKGYHFSEMNNIPSDLIEKMSDDYTDGLLELTALKRSDDGTKKFLFRLEDGAFVEAVLMNYSFGSSVCISTQVGCPMGCRFCSSGIDGFERNLTPFEMFAEVIQVKREADRDNQLTNIVLMGTGEPLLNYDNVLSFLHLVNDKSRLGIGMRNISLSTCGIVPNIKKLAREKLQLTLCLSLHAADDHKRRLLMPVAEQFSINETVSAVKEYSEYTGRRVTIEYIMIKDFNISRSDADKLHDLFQDCNAHFNLIPYNPGGSGDFITPSKKEIYAFSELLSKRNISNSVRRTLGSDIDGACGQLRAKYKKEGIAD